ncbi:MAG TPA: TonB-dependent receptor [Thermoanaerobaculaceae bacterium]|nr:TonB-dependent receptor [Thermoanaerobaculaceae bacterium]
MKFTRFVLVAAMLFAVALPALAQMPTGTLSGHVSDGKDPLPGVAVTLTSPNLQGARSSVTNANGDYILTFLPPGDYKAVFELQGFQTLETSVKINAAQTARLDATMPQSKIVEQVTVAGSYETISSAVSASTTLDASLQNKLPVARNLQAAVALTAGVSTTGPGGALTISGAQSYESLYLVNGVVVNENLRGQPTDLFIEDAIQETTTTTSGISAEYGRFSGGVVNTLTKSGGNEVHGSFRDTFDSDKWTAPTPMTVPYSRSDKINSTYEATLGGYLWKDRLWYFLAGRDRKTTGTGQTQSTDIVFPTGYSDKRYEGKLTFALTPEHRFVGSYIDRKREWSNYFFPSLPIVDAGDSVYNRQIPETLKAANYTGVLTDNFFVEGQYSARTLQFQNSGGHWKGDLIKGTTVYSNTQGYVGNAAIFCGGCEPEDRDNKDYFAKGSWFLSTPGAGSHDIVFGYDQYSDTHFSVNHQSPSDYWFSATTFVFGGKNWYPVVYGDGSADIDWYPILAIGTGSDFKQTGIFINDKWRLNNNWGFNIGARYDKNDGKTSIGITVAKDSSISPRLGVTFDPKGDGNMVFNASFSRYVMTIANTGNVADQSPQSPATFLWGYYGPEFNTNCDPVSGTNCMSPQDVLRGVFNWFDSVGGTSSFPDYGFAIPGYNRIIRGSLNSPYAEEIAAGVTRRLGNTGLVRLDYVHRNFKNAYTTRVDMGTGQVNVVALGQDWGKQDLGLIENSSFLKRTYDGVDLEANFQVRDSWTLGGNYTWSHTYGNFNGETSGSGPVTTTGTPTYYPEYQNVAWSNPSGNLGTDQRHRGRVWVVWQALNSKHNSLSMSLMQSYFSGTPYGAAGAVRSYLYVTNPGYTNRPSSVSYYFTPRDAFLTDAITRTDISVNYSFKFPALGKDIELFVIPAVTNVFNEHGVTSPNTTVYDYTNFSSRLASFNPFTTKPVECPQGATTATCKGLGANWQKGPNFGKPTSPAAYQTPRTISLSVGVRF